VPAREAVEHRVRARPRGASREGQGAGTFDQVASGLYAVIARATASEPGPRSFWLLPGGPIAQDCRLARLKPPAGAIDVSFGSVAELGDKERLRPVTLPAMSAPSRASTPRSPSGRSGEISAAGLG